MPNAIKIAAERKNIKSYDALAHVLIAHDKNAFAGKAPRYWSKMIGELDRHDGGRWSKHSEAMQSLVDFLGLHLDDLELQRKTSRLVFVPAVFPDFPPLSLVHEDIWTIAAPTLTEENTLVQPSRYQVRPTLDFWLKSSSHGTEPQRPQWLWVQDGVEFNLLAGKLDAVSRHRVLIRKCAQDALENNRDDVHYHRPLVLVLTDQQSPRDLELFLQHRHRAPLLVICRWDLPRRDETPAEQPPGTDKAFQPWFERWVWVLSAGWKADLLEWIETRFHDKGVDETLFSGDGVLKLLNQLDPGGQLFTCVEDVLALAQSVSQKGERYVGDALKRDDSSGEWLRRLAGQDKYQQDLVENFVQARWNTWRLPWTGGLSCEDWKDLETEHFRFEVLEMHAIAQSTGGYDFRRPLVARLLLRDYLIHQLKKGNTVAWLPACYDEERLAMLDAALDALTTAQLEQVARRISPSLAQREYLGAAETLFAAAGRRLRKGGAIGVSLAALLAIVVPRLHKVQEAYLPVSRSVAPPGAQIEWISVCWAWSLHYGPPSLFPPSWQFPGWHKELPPFPQFMTSFGASYSLYNWEREPLHMSNFLSVAKTWVARRSAMPQHGEEPPVLICARIAHATERRNAIDPGWWYAVIGNPGAEQALLDIVQTNGPPDRQTAFAWWPSLVSFRGREAKSTSWSGQYHLGSFSRDRSEFCYSILLGWVMRQLESHAENALSLLDEQDLARLAYQPAILPIPFRRALLTRLARNPDFRLPDFEVPGFLARFGPEIGDVVTLLLDHPQLGIFAAAYVWQWASGEAKSLLNRPLSLVATQNLFKEAPPHALTASLIALREHPNLLPPAALAQWARERLPDARIHAAELLHLLVLPK